jgi:preprotein translocase subunit SecA
MLFKAFIPVQDASEVKAAAPPLRKQERLQTSRTDDIAEAQKAAALAQAGQQPETTQQQIKGVVKIGRNDTCPCGSGKKYKACHGKEI